MTIKAWPLTSTTICITVSVRVALGRSPDDSSHNKPPDTLKNYIKKEKKKNLILHCCFSKASDQRGTKKKSIVSSLQTDEDLKLKKRWFGLLQSWGRRTTGQNISCMAARTSRCKKGGKQMLSVLSTFHRGRSSEKCAGALWKKRNCSGENQIVFAVLPTGSQEWEPVSFPKNISDAGQL